MKNLIPYKKYFSKSHVELLHIMTNNQCKLDKQTDVDIIYIKNASQKLTQLMSLLLLNIEKDLVCNSTVIYERDFLISMKDIIINWIATGIMNIVSDTNFECCTKLLLSRLKFLMIFQYWVFTIQNDQYHLFACTLYKKI